MTDAATPGSALDQLPKSFEPAAIEARGKSLESVPEPPMTA